MVAGPGAASPGATSDARASLAAPDRSPARPIGLVAARRAVTVHGVRPTIRHPLVVQLVPPANLAVGPVPWGLGSFVPADSYRQVSTATPDVDLPYLVSGLLAEADDRSLIIVVRDAHRHAVARQAVQLMLAGRPDAVS